MTVLQSSVKNHTQVLIALRNNRRLLARVKAFDRHSNMVRPPLPLHQPAFHADGVWTGPDAQVLINVKEMWTEVPKGKNKKPVNKDRFISKVGPSSPTLRDHPREQALTTMVSGRQLFLRGDSVILVLRHNA